MLESAQIVAMVSEYRRWCVPGGTFFFTFRRAASFRWFRSRFSPVDLSTFSMRSGERQRQPSLPAGLCGRLGPLPA
jgi:hypothetical protein